MLGKIHTVTFAGGDTNRLPGGRYLRVMEADGELTLTFYDESGQPIGEWVGVLGGFAIDASEFAEKLGLTTAIFGSVDVTSALAQSVEIAISRVPVFFDRLTGSVAATISAPDVFDSIPDVSLAATATTLIAAAAAGQAELIVSNPVGNTQTFRIGDSGAGAANGLPLAPGITLVLTTSAAVYGYNPGAGAESVAVARTST